MAEILFENKELPFAIAVGTILAGMAAALVAPASSNPLLTPWIKFDQLSTFFTLLFLSITLFCTLLAYGHFQKFEALSGEYYFFLLCALFGLLLIGLAADFLTLFLGIETLSISLYILCVYMKKWLFSHEASLKYFLLGSIAAAFLLYGIALVYGASGTTQIDALRTTISDPFHQALFLGGIALITLSFAFEAAIVPFHIWAPDVYAGAPTPVTAFMATGTKAGAFAAFARVFMGTNLNVLWNDLLSILICVTLIYANFVALRQTQMRRFFAYSGISHAGFLLIPFVVGTPEALSSVLFYLVVYVLATLAAFAVLSFLDDRAEGVTMDDLRGLYSRSPFLAAIFAISLLTLAGIPPTVGFLAKFYIFKVAFQAGYLGLVVVGLLTTILSAYYYLRFLGLMFAPSDKEAEVPLWSSLATGCVTAALLLILSFYPSFRYYL